MLQVHVASKDYICKTCGGKIPKGHKYYRDYIPGIRDTKEHTSCTLYDHLPHVFAETNITHGDENAR